MTKAKLMPRRSLLTAGTVALVLFAALALYWPSRDIRSVPNGVHNGHSQEAAETFSHAQSWRYNFTRHAQSHSLSHDQCEAAFPGLFDSINAAADSKKHGLIALDDIETKNTKCLMRVMVYEGELYIIQKTDCWVLNTHERVAGVLHLFGRALVSVPPSTIPNVEFIIDIDDDTQRPLNFLHGDDSNRTSVFGFTRKKHQKHIWLMPDYAFWSWPSTKAASHTEVRRESSAMNAAWPWEAKTGKVVWRGAPHLNPTLRGGLLRAAEGKSWGDVQPCDARLPETLKHCIKQPEHCKYKFPVHTEGYTYSGRLKYLQLCNSAPVVHDLAWEEFHTHLLQPEGPAQNYIAVKNDWSDLEGKITYYLQNEEEARRIAKNSHEAFFERHLAPAAVSCYLRRMMHNWRAVQGFEPEFFRKEQETGRLVPRGVPWEAYTVFDEYPVPPAMAT